MNDSPHRRFNPLSGEWVLVSPHRNKRPWQGQMEKAETPGLPEYDPGCYLCPGNARAGGAENPEYAGVYVFDNDFSALVPGVGGRAPADGRGLLRAEPESGVCRVVCFSPRHDLSLARMEPAQVEMVVEAWRGQYLELGARPDINHVQIFENRGLAMGCSNPHPHCQIWANATVPDIPATEGERQAGHMAESGQCLLCEYLKLELSRGERVVLENDHFVALAPFWAVWPYETMIIPRSHAPSMAALSPEERLGLAEIMVNLGVRYDNLFLASFPYSMGLHQAPTDGADHHHWHWHMHYYPPLLRSSTVRKFMVGYELLAMPQRDLTPEAAAARLRETPEVHYLDRSGSC